MHTERIARGAAWLDKEMPDWYTKIDTDHLYHTDDGCIIGQLFGDFSSYVNRRYFISKSIDDFAGESRFGFMAILLPNVALAVRFMIGNGFVTIRETPTQWRDAWIKEIQTRLDKHIPDHVPTEWEQSREVVPTGI